MNTRDDAVKDILDFLQSDKRSLLLTGTHQYEKHRLIIHILKEYVSDRAKVLFRANYMQNIGSFLDEHYKVYKTGIGYELGIHTLYFDSIKNTSWNNTEMEYDFAILYPLDNVLKSKQRIEILNDLFETRNINKLFLVSWTDDLSYDYSELKDYYDQHTVFDELEENQS
ncbi:hypothetical protein ACFCP7_28505 [Paenibacillus elgii]